MKVFISWSGEESRKIATELYDWLPMVVQSIQPYMSTESIDKGTRWASSIANELEGTQVGIVVLTPNNTSAPWINFEAGALAKVVDDNRLAPILFGLKPSDIGTPLSQFQVTLFNKDDILKLLKSINACGGDDALPETRLEKMHDALWNDLLSKVEPVVSGFGKSVAAPKKIENENSQILEELLVLARRQAAALHNPEQSISPSLIRAISDVVAEQGMSEKDRRHLRSMARALYRGWKDFSDVAELEISTEENDDKSDIRRKLAKDYDRVLRDLIDFIDHPRYRAGVGRFLIRDSSGRVVSVATPSGLQSLTGSGEEKAD